MQKVKFAPSLLLNTLWMIGGFAFRFIIQAIYFLIIARTLMPEGYGIFAGASALTTVLSPFATWGSGNILIKHVSRKPESFSVYWGAALITSGLSGAVLVCLSFLLGMAILGSQQAFSVLLPIAIGDLLGVRMAELSGQAFQSRHRFSHTSFMWFALSIFRLGGVVLLFVLPMEKTIEVWAQIYMLSGLAAGILGVLWVNYSLGQGIISLQPMKGEWREGFYFSIGLSAQGAYNDLDKTLLLRLTTDSIAGTYAVAYRILDVAFTPIKALLAASYPRFFQEGGKSLTNAYKFSIKLLPWVLAWGILGGLGLTFVSNFLQLILGEKYFLIEKILPWLAPLLLFRAFHYIASDTLTGSGYQGIRSSIQAGIAILNLILNLFWIPLYGWLGAAWSSLISDGLLAVIVWYVVWVLRIRNATQNN